MENTNEGFEKLEFVDSAEALQASMQADTAGGETQETEPTTEPAPTSEAPVEGQTQPMTFDSSPEPAGESEVQTTEASTEAPQYTESEIEASVMSFLSERLGREITSFDELNTPQEEARQIDERVKAIAEFVENTGRSPQEWFAYQQLNPSEMDDVTAIRVQLASEYPTLSSEEIGMLVGDKYKLDTNLYSEDEVKLSQLQLKIDATKAKQQIEDLRNQYTAPAREGRSESFITDEWVNNSSKEIDDLEGLQFDLGNGNTFQFGLDDSYRNQLKDKTARLDSYFDSFKNQDGSWNYDALHTQLAIADNIDAIVSSAYKQGKGDGQKGLVDTVANVDPNPTRSTGEKPVNSVAEQLKNIMGGGMTTFKI